MPVRTLGSKGVDLVVGPTSIEERNECQRERYASNIGWEENETPFIKMWKPLPSRRLLKLVRKFSISASGELESSI